MKISWFGNMENNFRVLLDFSELNCKSLKYVWMNISPRELITIKDFKNKILKKFSLQNNDLQLYLNDGLLLEDESIIILRENDIVRLGQNNSNIFNICISNIPNSEITQDSTDETNFSKNLKRKISSDVITTNSNEQNESRKRKKHKLSPRTSLDENNTTENPFSIQSINDNAEFGNINFIVPCKDKESKKKKKHKSSPKTSLDENNTTEKPFSIQSVNDNAEFENISFIVPRKDKKHKSHEKKKKSKHFHDKSAFKSNPCIATENEVILCEEFKIPEEYKMPLHCIEPKKKTKTGEQKEYDVVSDCCEKIEETLSSTKIDFENQGEKNTSDAFNADCITSNSQLILGSNCKKKKRKRHRKRKIILNNSLNGDWMDESHHSDLITGEFKDTTTTNTFNLVKESDVHSNIVENSYRCLPTTKTVKNNLSEVDKIATEHNIYPGTTTPLQRCTSQMSLNISNQNKVPETCSDTSNLSNHQSDYFKCSFSSTSSKDLPSAFNKQKKEEIYSNEDCSESQAINASNCKTISPIAKNNSGSSDSLKSIKFNLYSNKVKNWNSKYICPECPPLDSFPDVGIPIAFKILELDASYSPVISEYREGIVTAVNPQTDELEIELFQHEVMQGKTGKFENLYLDDLPSCEVIKKMTLQWSTLIDPLRLCSSR